MIILVGITASSNVFPPTKVIKLALAVSKATYLPLPTRRFIKNGAIIENPSTLLPRRILPLVYLPPIYDPAQDKAACSIAGWNAKVELDPVYTVPDSHSHDIEFGQFEVIFTLATFSMISC